MKVGIYVGSFDPPHKGHISVINHISNVLDKLIVIPTNSYWDKVTSASLLDRINMLKFYENDKVEISTTLNNYEYTYQILEELNKMYDDIYLIIGADNIVNFHLWKNVDDIVNNNKIYIVGRNNINIEDYLNKFSKDKFIIDKNFEMIDISSSEIRNNIDDKKELLDKKIYDYIKENNLYNKSHN